MKCFRSKEEVIELAGCDLLTLSPKLLGELEKTEGKLTRKLDQNAAPAKEIAILKMDEKIFREMHASNRMATDQLDEGIKGFGKSREALRKQLTKRLAEL